MLSCECRTPLTNRLVTKWITNVLNAECHEMMDKAVIVRNTEKQEMHAIISETPSNL